MRTAIYARVSTAEQTADNQLLSLRDFARARGFEIVAEYVDVASGGRDDRPQLGRMMHDAQRGKFAMLLFWSLDRISRRGVFHTLDLLNKLDLAGVNFRSYQQPELDTSSPFGPAIIAIFAALAKIERDLLRERTKAGLQRAKAKGAQLGRPRVVADRVRIREARAQGKTWDQIAAEEGISSTTAKRRAKSAA